MKRKIDNKTYLNYLLQSLNVDELKQICREYELKGFSKLTKINLIEFILDSLAEEEMNELINNKEQEIISDNINLAIEKINGKDRESLHSIKVVNLKSHEVELLFKGFNWEVKSFLSITQNNIDDPERDCDCRIGSNGGFCSHFWVGFIYSLKEGFFNLSDWSLTIIPDGFEKKVNSIKIEKKDTSKTVDETVSLLNQQSEDYQIQKHVDKSITIYEGEIAQIVQKQQEFQDNITIFYIASLKNVKIGPKVQKKSEFKEEDIISVDSLNLRISDKLQNTLALQAGDKITTSGHLEKDNFLRMYIVKNIRKIVKVS